MTTAFAVLRESGPAWSDGLSVLDQPGVAEHAAFMSGLAEAGAVLFAGPLETGGRFRALLVMLGEDEEQIRHHLADDPWSVAGRLQTASIERWTLLVGAERLAGQTPFGV